jgi:ornithine carbamoyltransferase
MLPLSDGLPARRFPVANVLLIVANFAVWLFYELPGLNSAIYHASYYPCTLDNACHGPLPWGVSWITAMFLHGGHAGVLEPGKGSWTLETEPGAVMDRDSVEHIVDAARVLGRYADALGVRSFPRGSDWAVARQDAIIKSFAKHCEKPVINLESARRHPCQELADAMTLVEKLGRPRGRKFVLSWTWHPKALPTAVPASAALAAARLGMEVVIARPEGFDALKQDIERESI